MEPGKLIKYDTGVSLMQVCYKGDKPKKGDIVMISGTTGGGGAPQPENDTGIWATPFNQTVKFDAGFQTIQTGVRFRDATQYRFIISAMEGSITGTQSYNNHVIPVLITESGTIFARLINPANTVSAVMKALYECRGQISQEGSSFIIFVNTIGDAIMGVYHYATLPGLNRIQAVMTDWNTELPQNTDVAERPMTGPYNLYWGFAQSPMASGPPDCDINMLFKIEQMAMVEAL